MKFKGTSGEWIQKGLHIFNEKNRIICQCCLMSFNYDNIGRRIEDEESKYNSLLISKSPKMLEMLIDTMNHLVSIKQMHPEMNHINQRILKLEKLIKEATEIK